MKTLEIGGGLRVFHGAKPRSAPNGAEKQAKTKDAKQARHAEKADASGTVAVAVAGAGAGAGAKDADEKADDVRLALFCVCTPFTPFPSIDSLQKESIFKTKHKIDLAFTSFDAKYVCKTAR